jgi:hypothetical protein
MADAATREQKTRPEFGLAMGSRELLCHTAMLCLILGAIKVVELWTDRLWPNKLFFDRYPVRYVFDGADLALLLGFLAVSVPVILIAYFRSKPGQ